MVFLKASGDLSSQQASLFFPLFPDLAEGANIVKIDGMYVCLFPFHVLIIVLTLQRLNAGNTVFQNTRLLINMSMSPLRRIKKLKRNPSRSVLYYAPNACAFYSTKSVAMLLLLLDGLIITTIEAKKKKKSFILINTKYVFIISTYSWLVLAIKNGVTIPTFF